MASVSMMRTDLVIFWKFYFRSFLHFTGVEKKEKEDKKRIILMNISIILSTQDLNYLIIRIKVCFFKLTSDMEGLVNLARIRGRGQDGKVRIFWPSHKPRVGIFVRVSQG